MPPAEARDEGARRQAPREPAGAGETVLYWLPRFGGIRCASIEYASTWRYRARFRRYPQGPPGSRRGGGIRAACVEPESLHRGEMSRADVEAGVERRQRPRRSLGQKPQRGSISRNLASLRRQFSRLARRDHFSNSKLDGARRSTQAFAVEPISGAKLRDATAFRQPNARGRSSTARISPARASPRPIRPSEHAQSEVKGADLSADMKNEVGRLDPVRSCDRLDLTALIPKMLISARRSRNSPIFRDADFTRASLSCAR